MRFKQIAYNVYHFIKVCIKEIGDNNIFKYSASLAYYTIFSIAPMMVIIFFISSNLFGQDAIEGRVYEEIKGLIGSDAAIQIQDTIKNIHLSDNSRFATIVSAFFLVLGASGIFAEIQDSLNKIWGLKVKSSKKAWWKLILNRLLSFSLIVSLGFVMMVSLILNALLALISSKINIIFSGSEKLMMFVIDNLVMLGFTIFIFGLIFKVLPDAKLKWKDITFGAVVTSLLFGISKIGIGYYLSTSNVASVYGAAGSIVIILLWAYYSSVILYIGAVFTKVYAVLFGGNIKPNDYSVWIKTEEVPLNAVNVAD